MRNKISGLAKTAILLTSLAVLAACAGKPMQHPNQPVVSVGSKIHLNITADVPLDENSVYIQNRVLVSAAQIDVYQIYCSVRMNRYQQADESRLKLAPGDFQVSRVRLYNDYVHSPVIYANNDDPFWEASFGIHYQTEIYLESAEQPQVKALICTRRTVEYQKVGYYPQRPQFENQLGNLADLP